MKRENVVVTTPESQYFGDLLSYKLGIPELSVVRKTFKDGEKYRRLDYSDRLDLMGKQAVFVASSHTDEAIDEVCYIGEQITQNGAYRLVHANPCFGYGTMEREVNAGEIVMGKRVAVRMSHVLAGDVRNSFLLLDTHIPTLTDMFEGNCYRAHLYAEPVLTRAIQNLLEREHIRKFKIGSADLSRLKWNKTYAKQLKANGLVAIDKDRDFEDVATGMVLGDPKGYVVIIYDDMIRSGDSLIKAADAYLEMGATAVYAVVSHFSLTSMMAFGNLTAAKIEKFIFTNSHPMSQIPNIAYYPERFKVVDVSDEYVEPIRKILQ